jgi:hypothetical protein
MLLRVVFYKFTYASEGHLASSFRIGLHSSILNIVLASSSEMSVNYYQTIRCHISKDNHLLNRDCKKGEVFSVYN